MGKIIINRQKGNKIINATIDISSDNSQIIKELNYIKDILDEAILKREIQDETLSNNIEEILKDIPSLKNNNYRTAKKLKTFLNKVSEVSSFLSYSEKITSSIQTILKNIS